MIRKIGSAIFVGIVVFAIYKYFGGDIGAFFSTALDVFIKIVDQGSDAVLEGFKKLTS